MLYLKLGFRNIRKNFRKNLLTILMMSFGMTALYVYTGSNANMFSQFRDSVIREQFGSFQLHRKGYAEYGKKDPYAYLIPGYAELERELLRDADIDYVAPRLSFAGILAGDEKSVVVKGFAGNFASEARMEYGKTNRGFFPEQGSVQQAVLGELALAKIAAEPNDGLTLLATMKGGGISGADFTITGTRKSFGENDVVNSMFMLADIGDMQTVLGVGDSAETVIIHLKDQSSFSRVEKNLQELCRRYGLEYRKWSDLAVFYERSRQVFMMNQHILTAVLLLISVFIIVNTMYMTYMERVREIGTMRAIGTSKRQVGFVFFYESILLAAAGSTAGVLTGAAIAETVRKLGGIRHPSSVFNDEAYYTFIAPDSASILIFFFLFVLVSAAASVLISARAGKLSIADSLRWN